MVRRKVVKYATAAAGRAGEHTGSKVAVMLAPVVPAVLELLLAWLIHARWGHGSAMVWIAAGLTTSTFAIAWLVLVAGRDRTPIARLHSLVTTVLVGLHLIASSQLGPWSSPLIDLWLWGAATVVTTWSIRLRIASSATLHGGSIWDQTLAIAGIEGRFRPTKATAERVQGTLQLNAGETVDDAQKRLPALASALAVPPSGVRMTVDPDNASRAGLTVVRHDVLRRPIPYQGPSLIGGSCAEPYRIGRYEDMEPALLPIDIPGMGLSHLLVQGMTGAGKTGAANVIMAEKFTRVDVYTIVIDTVKGPQTLRPWLPGLDWVEQTESRALALFNCLKDNTIPYLSNQLGRLGLDKWKPGCGLPRLDIHIEEASGLVSGCPDFARVCERSRSVGIGLTASLQRSSYTSIDVAARSQFGTVLCLGVKEEEDARFALPDEVVDAGADPSRWQNRQPGCAFLTGPGIAKDRWTTPLRIELPTVDELLLLARYNGQHGAQLPEGIAATFGELYTSRVPVEKIMASSEQIPVTTPAPVDAPPLAPAAAAAPAIAAHRTALIDAAATHAAAGGEITEEEVMRIFNSLPEDDRPAGWMPPADDPEPDVQPGIDDEPEELAVVVSFGPPSPRLGDEEAHQLFLSRLDELQAAGVDAVRGKDLQDLAVQAGRTSPNWVYKKLKQQVKYGRMVQNEDSSFSFVRDRNLVNA
jgi:hypothetical protein